MICPNCKSDDVKVQVVAEQKSVAFLVFAFGLFWLYLRCRTLPLLIKKGSKNQTICYLPKLRSSLGSLIFLNLQKTA